MFRPEHNNNKHKSFSRFAKYQDFVHQNRSAPPKPWTHYKKKSLKMRSNKKRFHFQFHLVTSFMAAKRPNERVWFEEIQTILFRIYSTSQGFLRWKLPLSFRDISD
jgi:arginyl-tRNA--protein-N-Asp/Glu arginylyltransferase